MKLRFRQDSLRIRLNRHEAQGLAQGAILEEKVHFPGDTDFRYILQGSRIPSPDVSFTDGVIRIRAPQGELKDWASGDSIGLYFDLPAKQTTLRVAIEKDLECVDGSPDEGDPDAFPRDRLRKNC